MMRWRGLLVSVRDAGEAAAALAGGATIIDVKEPAHGSLGRADPPTIAAIAGVVGTQTPWTMACGELREGIDTIAAHLRRVVSLLPAAAEPPAAVKVGLAGMAGEDWGRAFRDLLAALPAGPDRVAVAYADWQAVRAPPPRDVVELAAAAGCAAILVDTCDKAGGGLLDCCPAGQVAGLVAEARRAGLQVAVAGRRTIGQIPAIWALGPDVVALRSAVCSNGPDGSGRLGRVREHLVRRAGRLRDSGSLRATAVIPPGDRT